MSPIVLTPDAVTELERREHELSDSLRRAKAHLAVMRQPGVDGYEMEEMLRERVAYLSVALDEVTDQLDGAEISESDS